jgi:hypothetical protein
MEEHPTTRDTLAFHLVRFTFIDLHQFEVWLESNMSWMLRPFITQGSIEGEQVTQQRVSG